MKIKELIDIASLELQGVSQSPRLDAELLLAHLCGGDRVMLVSRAYDQASQELHDRYQALVRRRYHHEPVAYIVGDKEFFGLSFLVSPAVLVPRPETEMLVEQSLAFLETVTHAPRILDLGTGSGCIAVAIAHEFRKTRSDFEIIAVDRERAALDVASQNAKRHGVDKSVQFMESDWFSIFAEDQRRFDLIVSNPPYIAVDSNECSPELRFEPQHALFAGSKGVDSIAHLLQKLPEYLASGGLFLCEIGHQQREPIELLIGDLQHKYPESAQATFIKDLANRNRVLSLKY